MAGAPEDIVLDNRCAGGPLFGAFFPRLLLGTGSPSILHRSDHLASVNRVISPSSNRVTAVFAVVCALRQRAARGPHQLGGPARATGSLDRAPRSLQRARPAPPRARTRSSTRSVRWCADIPGRIEAGAVVLDQQSGRFRFGSQAQIDAHAPRLGVVADGRSAAWRMRTSCASATSSSAECTASSSACTSTTIVVAAANWRRRAPAYTSERSSSATARVGRRSRATARRTRGSRLARTRQSGALVGCRRAGGAGAESLRRESSFPGRGRRAVLAPAAGARRG